MTRFRQLVQPLPRRRAHRHGARMMALQHLQERRVGDPIHLVQHQQRRLVAAAEFLQHRVDGLDLLLGVRSLASTTCSSSRAWRVSSSVALNDAMR